MTQRPARQPSAIADALAIVPVDGPLDADVTVPGSKSETNRALVCAALAEGTTILEGALFADDTEAMLGVLAGLGVDVRADEAAARVTVTGAAGAIGGADAPIDVRQSGTTARFTMALLAAGTGRYEVTAHPQMQARPMGETFEALRRLGLDIEPGAAAGHLPATVTVPARASEAAPLRIAGDVSSQFLSGLLLVAPCLPGGLTIELTTELVSRPYVELTVAVMRAFGALVDTTDPSRFVVSATGYRACRYAIEPDASAASYPLAAAAMCGGRVLVRGLGPEARQGDAAFTEVLAAMGADVEVSSRGTQVSAGGTGLSGGTFDLTHLSDTAQTLAVVAPFATEPVTITGIGFIRRKEIDRIAAVGTELTRCGIGVRIDDDGWTIEPGPVRPAVVRTYDDHRMAMSFALLGLVAPGIEISDPGCVAKTFPGYWRMLEALRTGGHDAS